GKDLFGKGAYHIGLTGSYHIVISLLLLKHKPHRLDIVSGKTPVPFGIEITEIHALQHPHFDPCRSPGDLPCYKGLTAPGRLMIEKYAITGIHIITLAVVLGDVEGISLGTGIR